MFLAAPEMKCGGYLSQPRVPVVFILAEGCNSRVGRWLLLT
jgi:hypothetical protein